MIFFWVTKIKVGLSTIDDVPPWYLEQVKKDLDEQGIPY